MRFEGNELNSYLSDPYDGYANRKNHRRAISLAIQSLFSDTYPTALVTRRDNGVEYQLSLVGIPERRAC